MAKNFVAVFLVCIVILSAFNLHDVEAANELDEKYKSCFNSCHKPCTEEGNGNSLCEVKCDGECSAIEDAGN